MNFLFLSIICFATFPSLQGTFYCNDTKHGQIDEKAWCIPKEYDPQRPPFLYRDDGAKKMNLHFTFSIREISEVRDAEQVMKIPMYLAVEWKEVRLVINSNHFSWEDDSTGPKGENTEEAETMKHLWKPNLEIYGLEDFTTHKVLGEMAGLRITKEKYIKYDTKVTLEISCQMDFTMYPFDSHTCTFQVGSYFYDMNSITCSSQLIDPSIESDFVERNLQHIVGWRNLSEEKTVVRLTSGSYAACGFEILLTRKHEPLVYQVYIPCILFVTVSWISFIIDPKVVPGRMSLLVILFLVIINTFNAVKVNAPSSSSSSLNAIESFIVTCIFSIFSAIIEYAVILAILTLRTEPKAETSYSLASVNNENVEPSVWKRMNVLVNQPRIFDGASIVIFPVGFFLYNIHYWFIADYTYKSSGQML